MRTSYVILVLSIGIYMRPHATQGQQDALILNSLSVRDNLSSQRFNDKVFRDSRGTVWISSIEGLNKYEGGTVDQTLSDPTLTHPQKLAEPNILSDFFEDTQGNIWFNTSSYLHRFNRQDGTFGKFDLENFLLEKGVQLELIFLDSSAHQLWLASDTTLFITSINSPTTPIYRHKIPSVKGFGARMGLLDGNKLKYVFVPVAEGGALIVLPSDTSSIDWKQQALAVNNPCHTFLPIPENQALVGTDRGVIHFHIQGDKKEHVYAFKEKSLGKIIGIHPYEEDLYLLLSATAEVYIYNASRGEVISQYSIFLTQNYGAIPSKFRQSYLDEDRTLWISSESQGIFFTNLSKKKFSTLLKKPPSSAGPLNDIISMAVNSKGHIWCLTSNGIQVTEANGEVMDQWEGKLEALKQAYGDSPYSLFIDQEDRIWICSFSGLFIFYPQKGRFSQVGKDLKNLHPTFAIERLKGEIWVSSILGIWKILDRGSTFQVEPIFPDSHPASTQAFGYLGEWGREKIVVNIPNESLHIYSIKEGLLLIDSTFELPYLVQGMAIDRKDSSLWLTTSQGLFHLEADSGRYRLHFDPYLPLSSFSGIIQAADGAFWIGSVRGLIRYEPAGTFWRYTLADGLSSLQYLFWSYSVDSLGRYLFGSTNGITVVQPERIQELTTEARPTLSQLWVNDSLQSSPLPLGNQIISYHHVSEITLPYHRNTLSFRFAAREYSDPGSNRFRFQLVGVDDSTVNIGIERFARYPNLAPNTYLLKLEATNSDGKWSPHTYSLKIVITPPWYKTWWFRSLMASIMVLAIYSIVKNRINRIKKDALFKQKEAEYKQQVAEVEAAVLKLQMNPHFIFNSLGSVQNYLAQNHTDSAERMLNKFIPFIRRILDYSVEEFITLTDEIDLLKDYVGIENMRFRGEVKFEVEVAVTIDPEETLIPPMILQPFVENALKHGISSLSKGGGEIHLSFKESNGYLLCTIKDNGRGRAMAENVNSQKEGHVSKATEITTRRIQLLKEKGYPDCRLEIIDLLDSSQQGIGTEVKMYVPLIQ